MADMDKSSIGEVAVLLKKANELSEDARASLETGKAKIELDYDRLRHIEALLGYIEHARDEAAELLKS